MRPWEVRTLAMDFAANRDKDYVSLKKMLDEQKKLNQDLQNFKKNDLRTLP